MIKNPLNVWSLDARFSMTNQQFCYWLQGYLEICQCPDLTREKVILINNSLDQINEPLGSYTGWLKKLIQYFASQDYPPTLLTYFLPEIQHRLNLIFEHVIDNSYETELSSEVLQQIHDGPIYDQ